jgi:SAM-dependent methyltransferase
MSIFWEIHRDLPREGPGDEASTQRAFGLLGPLPPNPLIVDIGCGPGLQSRHLAQLSGGRVVALDAHRPFLQALQHNAAGDARTGRVLPAQMSMFALGLPAGAFDVVWSEGAIYILGFDAGLQAAQRLLKPGGRFAFTEVSWIAPDPPEEIARFWAVNYPAMRTAEANRAAVRAAGFRELGAFTLPDEAWFTHYYGPMRERVKRLREQHASDPDWQRALDGEEEEIRLFEQYSRWYGYVFYIGEK